MATVSVGFQALDLAKTSLRVNLGVVNSGNLDAIQLGVAGLGQVLENVSLSGSRQETIGIKQDGYNPANAGGNRGEKWAIRWYAPLEGIGGQYGENEIGCADRSKATFDGTRWLLTGTDYDDLKAQFDAIVKTENGNAVEVYEVEYVTRTL